MSEELDSAIFDGVEFSSCITATIKLRRDIVPADLVTELEEFHNEHLNEGSCAESAMDPEGLELNAIETEAFLGSPDSLGSSQIFIEFLTSVIEYAKEESDETVDVYHIVIE